MATTHHPRHGLSRKRWVDRQPGAFRGAIRLVDGELEGIAPKWRRGYGRWVRDVFVWTKAPLLFRNELLPADGVGEQRTAAPGEVKRLGDKPRRKTAKSGQRNCRGGDEGRRRRTARAVPLTPTETSRPATDIASSANIRI